MSTESEYTEDPYAACQEIIRAEGRWEPAEHCADDAEPHDTHCWNHGGHDRREEHVDIWLTDVMHDPDLPTDETIREQVSTHSVFALRSQARAMEAKR